VPTELRFQCFKITSIETTGQTAVKIIILGFVSVGLVTIDKLCKAVDQDMRISDIQWLEKQGGKSGQWRL
jgi:cyclic pyranopterin phosphate synthase